MTLLASSLALSSCGGGSSGGVSAEPRCDAWVSRLHACGLVPKNTDVQCTEPPKDQTCTADCIISAVCSELEAVVCSNSYTGALETCTSGCDALGTDFTCRDGTSVGAYQRCDGSRDCADGSDEDGCATFTCKDGIKVLAAKRCDQIPDCADASDENGCPTFTCKDGQLIPAEQHCNGLADCNDGTDEVGCPPEVDTVAICK